MTRKVKHKRTDLAQAITDQLIVALEKGTSPWRKPWKSLGVAGRGQAFPHNATTGKAYRGMNVTLLMLAGNGYVSSGWLTFKQAKDLGGNVKGGEKGTMIIFWKFLSHTETADDGTESERKFPMMRSYSVFSVEQCENLPERITNPTSEPVEEIPDLAKWVSDALNVKVRFGGDRAFYAHGPDQIQLPNRSQFKSETGFNGTLLHESTHATGNKKRLDRPANGGYGSADYAFEELIAEIGSSMLCAYLSLDYEIEGHASYIENWLKALKNDKRFIFKAASQSQAALDYILQGAGMIEKPEPEQVKKAA